MLTVKSHLKRIVATGVAVAVAALMAPPAWVACFPGSIVSGTDTASAAPQQHDGYFYFEVEGNPGHESATITGYDEDTGPADVVIPETLGGVPVKFIGKNAFDEGVDYGETFEHPIKSVKIPASVETILDSAFAECTSLSKVTLVGDNLYYIGDLAFSGCKKLTSFPFNASLAQISYGAFARTGLTSVSLPKEVYVESGDGMNPFAGCPIKKFSVASGSKNQKVANSGTLLTGEDGEIIAFAAASGVKSVKIPSSASSINDYAFYKSSITSVTLHKKVYSIGEGCFDSSKSLSKVVIPTNSKLGTIGGYAFFNCPKLAGKKVYMPKSIKNIGEDAFGTYIVGEGSAEPEREALSGFYFVGPNDSYEALKYAETNKIVYMGNSSVKKLTSKKKSLKVKVKSAKGVSKSKKAYKYQIAYKQKGKKSWKKVKSKKTTKTIKKLKKGKKYQVKVRSMKKKGSKTYYGEWSAVKTSKKIK